MSQQFFLSRSLHKNWIMKASRKGITETFDAWCPWNGACSHEIVWINYSLQCHEALLLQKAFCITSVLFLLVFSLKPHTLTLFFHSYIIFHFVLLDFLHISWLGPFGFPGGKDRRSGLILTIPLCTEQTSMEELSATLDYLLSIPR